MIRLHWLRHCEALALLLAIGATSGCINSHKFTSGRLPYSGGDQLAATSPRDPFLTGGSKPSSETKTASAASSAQPASFGAPSNAPYYAAVQNSAPQNAPYAMPAGGGQSPQYAMPGGAPQAAQYAMPASAQPSPQYAMNATTAGAPTTDMRQVAYTPSGENPFNAAPSAPAVSRPMPPQMQSYPSPSQIEQISYEMPAGMPAGSGYETNPFAEVQETPNPAYQQPMSYVQPLNGADAWQPSPSGGFAAGGFLPPQ